MSWIIFFASLIITVALHEAGHLIVSLLCKVKVKAFSIGFWKPYIHFKWKDIDWRLTPWLIGGYCELEGETTKNKNGLLIQPYRKKVIIALAGVFVNLVIALICYVINYKNIFVGLWMDWLAIKSIFVQNTEVYLLLYQEFVKYEPNVFLWQLSMMNIFCFVTNLLPIPALDGGYLWIPWMEYIWKENYIKYLNILVKWCFLLLMLIQIFIIGWILLK
ncbi:MAG: site-2 protease family protein [Candidatus Helarchaeota archaeon]